MMRELTLMECHAAHGGGFLTGLGVFIIVLYVDEIVSKINLLLNRPSCEGLVAELAIYKAKVEQYHQLYGDLPTELIT